MAISTKPGGLTLVGLGPGDPGALTLAAREAIAAAAEIYLRTKRHPGVEALTTRAAIRSFDALYDELPTFEAVYDAIVQRVLELARRPEGVVYAVPGHPIVAEATGLALLNACPRENIPCRLVPGVSFIEAAAAAVPVDPLAETLQIADSLDLDRIRLDPARSALIAQVYNLRAASLAKLALLNLYPPEHPVTVIAHAGIPGEERTETVPLAQLDHANRFDHLTCLYLPAVDPLRNLRTFEGFAAIIERLRAPDGCPWDRKQTHASLKGYLLEEAYEVLATLDEDDLDGLREELGDLLLQIMLHVQVAKEAGEFDAGDVIEGIAAKIIRRHPHVFGSAEAETAEEVAINWEAIKREERGGAPLLEAVPISLPALAHAQSLQDRAARVGFDWPHMERALDKLVEELRELEDAPSTAEKLDEFGDVLFMLTGVARKLGIDAEEALRLAARKFRVRFAGVETLARQRGHHLEDLTLEQMEDLWQEVKRHN